MKIQKPNGRPTQFKPEFVGQAHRLCLLGMTDDQMALFFEVSERTIHRWKTDSPEFSEALRGGKVLADGNVARSLYERATGCSHAETSVNVVAGEVVLTEVTKHYAPEVTAAKFWLINRQPHKWKDRVEVKEDININVFPSKEVLDGIYAKSLAQAAEWATLLEGRRERLGIVIENRENY